MKARIVLVTGDKIPEMNCILEQALESLAQAGFFGNDGSCLIGQTDRILTSIPSLAEPDIKYLLVQTEDGQLKIVESGRRWEDFGREIDFQIREAFLGIVELSNEIRTLSEKVDKLKQQVADWRRDVALKKKDLKFGLWDALNAKYYGEPELNIQANGSQYSLHRAGTHLDWLPEDDGRELLLLSQEIDSLASSIENAQREIGLIEQRREFEPQRLKHLKERFALIVSQNQPEMADLLEQGRLHLEAGDDKIIARELKTIDRQIPQLPEPERILLALHVNAKIVQLPEEVSRTLQLDTAFKMPALGTDTGQTT